MEDALKIAILSGKVVPSKVMTTESEGRNSYWFESGSLNFLFKRRTARTAGAPIGDPKNSMLFLISSSEMSKGMSRITPWHEQKLAGTKPMRLFLERMSSSKSLLASNADFKITQSLLTPLDFMSTIECLCWELEELMRRPNPILWSLSFEFGEFELRCTKILQ